MVIFHSYVKLPEGRGFNKRSSKVHPCRNAAVRPWLVITIAHPHELSPTKATRMEFLWCFPQIARWKPTVRSVWRLLYSKNICIKTQTPEMSKNYDILWGAHDWNWTYPVSHTHELPPAIRYPMNYIEITAIILVGSVFLLGKSVFLLIKSPIFLLAWIDFLDG